ncbi:MAG: F0F1 ATP synthase subunit epsilon [Legionellales bacterium]|nr:MAG: F0F1 ATP synthase subunit epsilon [Legionellales bacterium]
MTAANCFQVAIVSAEAEIFVGSAAKIAVTGAMGELEVLCNHAPLLTSLIPGPVWLTKADGTEEAFFVSGGILEVQHNITTILADTAIRATDVDEAAALAAKKYSEQGLADLGADFNYTEAHSKLLAATAQLRILRQLRKKK